MADPDSSITARLAERITATGAADLGPEVRVAANRLVLDGLAVAMAGAREPAPSTSWPTFIASRAPTRWPRSSAGGCGWGRWPPPP